MDVVPGLKTVLKELTMKLYADDKHNNTIHAEKKRKKKEKENNNQKDRIQ